MDYTYIVCYKPALTLCTLQVDVDRIHHKDRRQIRPTLADLSLPIHDFGDHKHSTTTLTTTITTTSAGGNKEDRCLPGNESSQQQQQQPRKQPQIPPPLHIVGRLDRNSEGLLLLTNDGQFTARVLSPPLQNNNNNNNGGSSNCTKRYWALVESMYSTKTRTRYPGRDDSATPTSVESALQEMRAGGLSIRGTVTLPPRLVRIIYPDEIQAMGLVPMDQSSTPPTTTTITTVSNGSGRGSDVDDTTRRHTMWLEFVLQEGKNRQVRRITADAGYKTLRLVRVAIGALELHRCLCSDMKEGGGSDSIQQPRRLQMSHELQLKPGQWMYIDKSNVLGGG
jgi:16S rRNA U516 pseudouridylate synthase RsuA-like enzyme